VVTQIRVGGMKARHLDESIPLKYGIIGQETTGPGGMFKALRTIPPMLKIAEAVAKIAPHAVILNYTNPSAIITEAVSRHSKAHLIGLCAGIPSMQDYLHGQLKADYPEVQSYAVGLNHLGFIHRIESKGKDITEEALAKLYPLTGHKDEDEAKEAHMIRTLGAIPNGYMHYYYHRGEMLKHQKEAKETRAEQVQKLEDAILKEAAEPSTDSKPKALEERGGGGYSDITFGFMDAIHNDSKVLLTCSRPNGSSVDGIEPDAVVEVTCTVGKQGAAPVKTGKIPAAFRGVVQAVKDYESLTVEAAVTRSRRLAIQALLNHPMVGDLDVVEPMVDEMLKAHGLEFK
jgi:6-phospho-beta-glucosidase